MRHTIDPVTLSLAQVLRAMDVPHGERVLLRRRVLDIYEHGKRDVLPQVIAFVLLGEIESGKTPRQARKLAMRLVLARSRDIQRGTL